MWWGGVGWVQAVHLFHAHGIYLKVSYLIRNHSGLVLTAPSLCHSWLDRLAVLRLILANMYRTHTYNNMYTHRYVTTRRGTHTHDLWRYWRLDVINIFDSLFLVSAVKPCWRVSPVHRDSKSSQLLLNLANVFAYFARRDLIFCFAGGMRRILSE